MQVDLDFKQARTCRSLFLAGKIFLNSHIESLNIMKVPNQDFFGSQYKIKVKIMNSK